MHSGSAALNGAVSPLRSIAVVTVSAIPNLTGTSVNPLFRAASLVAAGWRVTLYLPWFKAAEQEREYGRRFADTAAQVAMIDAWLPASLRPYRPEIAFYNAHFDATWTIPQPSAPITRALRGHDIVILEELERHFLKGRWLDPGVFRFRRKFPLVIAILHTNPAAFIGPRLGAWSVPLTRALSAALSRQICHHSFSVVSVSPVLRDPDEGLTSLNGVAPAFFETEQAPRGTQGAYFIGKLIPEKGLHHAFRLLDMVGADRFDLFGSGDLEYVRALEAAHGVRAVLHGGTATPWRTLAPYRVFVNCSISEVLCTTTAEALAMRKWVILPRHPSNQYFESFANCLVYTDEQSFVSCWRRAMAEEPSEDPAAITRLSWAAATQRLTKVLHAPPEKPYHDPLPFFAAPGRERRVVRRWLLRPDGQFKGSFNGTHVPQRDGS